MVLQNTLMLNQTYGDLLSGAVSTGPGRAIVQGWGYSGDDVAEIEERLQVMASAFDVHDEFY